MGIGSIAVAWGVVLIGEIAFVKAVLTYDGVLLYRLWKYKDKRKTAGMWCPSFAGCYDEGLL